MSKHSKSGHRAERPTDNMRDFAALSPIGKIRDILNEIPKDTPWWLWAVGLILAGLGLYFLWSIRNWCLGLGFLGIPIFIVIMFVLICVHIAVVTTIYDKWKKR